MALVDPIFIAVVGGEGHSLNLVITSSAFQLITPWRG